jgi:CheY-like chemotaxis protein
MSTTVSSEVTGTAGIDGVSRYGSWFDPQWIATGSGSPRKTPPGKPRPDAASAAGKDRPLVLIVDDHGGLLQMMARWLGDEGYELLLASDAHAALELVDRAGRRLNLAVVDVRLPGVDGPGLVRSLRQRRTSLPVLYITGYAEEAQQRELHDPVLAKPFIPDRLAQEVRALLARGSKRPHRPDRM